MEFSQNYCFFYDQLEKSNLFLQGIIDTREKPMDDKMVVVDNMVTLRLESNLMNQVAVLYLKMLSLVVQFLRNLLDQLNKVLKKHFNLVSLVDTKFLTLR